LKNVGEERKNVRLAKTRMVKISFKIAVRTGLETCLLGIAKK
jgi:hypothetical protein